MVKRRSRTGEEREEPEKKPKLSPRSGSRTGEEREVPKKKTKMGRGRSRTGAARSGSRTGEEREEPEKKTKLSPLTTRSGSRTGEEREVPKKKTKLSPLTTRSGSRTGEEREVPKKKTKMGRGRSRTGAAKKTKLSMDHVVSIDSTTKAALERIPRTVVCFRYRPRTDQRFKRQLAEFGRILMGPYMLPFLHDYAFVHYAAQDAADKALQQPICHNINDTALDAVCQAAYNLVKPHVLPHPANTLVYVSNVCHEASLDQIRVFFSRFGEIAEGPIWLEMEKGSSFGFTLVVYKTEEGAKAAVEQPHKYVGGHQVHCSRNLDAIIHFHQGQFVYHLQNFVDYNVKHLPSALRQPLGGAHI